MNEIIYILLVEDDDNHAEIVQYYLAKVADFKCIVERVNSMALGHKKLQENTYDVVLADLSYPDSTANESLAELTTWITKYRKPFVILTSLNDKDMGRKAIKAGFDDYIAKDKLSVQLLEKVIPYAIERHKIGLELKNAHDKAVKAMKAKADFLAVMSHEIRTPLNGIIGALGLIKDCGNLNEEQEDLLNTINFSSDSLLQIINDILEFSKLEAGKIILEKISFSLRDLIRSISIIFMPVANDKGLEFIAPLPPENIYAKGDPNRIRQIIVNLTNNALKFTSSGFVLIDTKIEDLGEKLNLKFAITDSGVGISKESLATIFDKFSQEDSSITRKFGGTGLGLAISKQLAVVMGGQLSVTSTPGKGSCFTVEFIVEKSHEVVKNDDNDSGSVHFSGKGLIVEDNAVNQKIATKILRKMGLKITVMHDGLEAVNEVQNNQYDIIFMDMMMPVMDGITATQKLREKKITTPIIAMTANAFQEDKDKCFEAGMDGYLSKPLQKKQIINELKRFLK